MPWPRPTAETTDVGSGPPRRSGPWPAVDGARARMEMAAPPGGSDTAGDSGDPQAPRARGQSDLPSGPSREPRLAGTVGRDLARPGRAHAELRRPRDAVRRRRRD